VRRRTLGIAYVFLLFGWSVYVLLYPTWIGQSYFNDGGQIRATGVFGLEGGTPFRAVAPLWQPPVAGGDGMLAVTRLPWESIQSNNHVELLLPAIASRLALGALAIGCIYCSVGIALGLRRTSRLLVFAMWLSAFIAVTYIGFIVVAVLTGGYGLTDDIVLWGAAGGVCVGTAVGAWRAVRLRPTPSAPG
jgi:hypothetical protein